MERTPRRSDVDFEANEFLILLAEELYVEEAFSQVEGFHGGEAEVFEVLGDFALIIVEHVQLVVDGFHDAFVEDEGVHEDDVAAAVNEAVEGVDLAFNEFFHDVIRVRLGFKTCPGRRRS